MNNFNSIIKQSNITTPQLCKLTGISRSLMSAYKAGKYEPSGLNLLKISLALGVPPYLFYRDDETLKNIVRKTGHIW